MYAKPITIDLRKEGCEELYDYIRNESSKHKDRMATTIIEMLKELKDRREMGGNTARIVDADNNTLAKIKA